MTIYEIYFYFCLMLLVSMFVWRWPTITAIATHARRRRSLAAGLLTCTGVGKGQEPLTSSQGYAVLALLAAVVADWLLASHSYLHYRSLFYTKASCQTLLAARALGSAAAAVLTTGNVGDTKGRRGLCVGCGGLLAAAAILTCVWDSFPLLCIGALLQGASACVLRCSFESWLAGEWHRRQMTCEWLSTVAALVGTASALACFGSSFAAEALVLLLGVADTDGGTGVTGTTSRVPVLLAAAGFAALSCLLARRMRRSPREDVALPDSAARRPTPLRLATLTTGPLRAMAVLRRDRRVRWLLVVQACVGTAATLVSFTWGPTLALLDDLLPYGLCGADFALATAYGASAAGLLFGFCEYRAQRTEATRTAGRTTLPTASALDVYGRLSGNPLLIACLAAAGACLTLARTIYPVFTMSAFMLLAGVNGFVETVFFVLRAAVIPEAQRTTITALLLLPQYLAAFAFLGRERRALVAPTGTQAVARLGCVLCVGGAVGTRRLLTWIGREKKRKDGDADTIIV